MLVEDADAEARILLESLFASESEDEVEAGFEDLKALNEWREKRAREAESAMGNADKPVFGRRVRQTELEAALAEWTEIAERSQGTEPPSEGSVPDE